jgi:hypothetical protein
MPLRIDLLRPLAVLLCASLLTGCAVFAPPAPPPPPPAPPPAPVPVVQPAPPPPQVDPAAAAARRVLAYHERVRQMSAPELTQELARLNAAPGGPATTLELALALGYTRNNGDLARGLSLLESLLRINTPEIVPWQPAARLIAARYAEQRKLEEQIERQNQQLKDSQRKLDQLNEKLEALKAIERSLTVRAPTMPPAGSAPQPAAAPASKAN